jgi:hypothetical protein
MGRTFRYILKILLFSLLVSASGVAQSQILSQFITYEDVAMQCHFDVPYVDRLEDGSSDINQREAIIIRKVAAVSSYQTYRQMRRIGQSNRGKRYLSETFDFTQHFVLNHTPPPRPSVALL